MDAFEDDPGFEAFRFVGFDFGNGSELLERSLAIVLIGELNTDPGARQFSNDDWCKHGVAERDTGSPGVMDVIGGLYIWSIRLEDEHWTVDWGSDLRLLCFSGGSGIRFWAGGGQFPPEFSDIAAEGFDGIVKGILDRVREGGRIGRAIAVVTKCRHLSPEVAEAITERLECLL